MKIGFITLLFLSIVFAENVNYTVDYKEKLKNFLCNTKDDGNIWVYKLKQTNYTLQDLHNFALIFKMDVDSEIVAEDYIAVRQNNAIHLTFDSEYNSITYSNNSIGVLSEEDVEDTSYFRILSKQYVDKITGKVSDKFVFVNCHYEYYVSNIDKKEDGSEANPRLAYITYRYIRKLDGRHIVGTTNSVEITMGKNGEVCSMKYIDMKLVKAYQIKMKLKSNKVFEYLDKKVKNDKFNKFPDGENAQWKQVDVISSTLSYNLHKGSDGDYLIPFVTFYSLNQREDDEIMPSYIHIPLSMEMYDNAQEDDFEVTKSECEKE